MGWFSILHSYSPVSLQSQFHTVRLLQCLAGDILFVVLYQLGIHRMKEQCCQKTVSLPVRLRGRFLSFSPYPSRTHLVRGVSHLLGFFLVLQALFLIFGLDASWTRQVIFRLRRQPISIWTLSDHSHHSATRKRVRTTRTRSRTASACG